MPFYLKNTRKNQGKKETVRNACKCRLFDSQKQKNALSSEKGYS